MPLKPIKRKLLLRESKKFDGLSLIRLYSVMHQAVHPVGLVLVSPDLAPMLLHISQYVNLASCGSQL
jgi:enhancing lycopene biosynthesis protein 2